MLPRVISSTISSTPDARLAGLGLHLAYERATVVHGVDLHLRAGRVTALVGPNGSGKSTVLRGLARRHRIDDGRVELDGAPSAPLSAVQFARRVTLLAQSRPEPNGLTVGDVVAFGRHPHRRRFATLSDTDRAAIGEAMTLTGLTAASARPVDQLSGGELQRVWLATCLAQQTDVLLLDEPTNHLDLRYQMEILELVRDLADTRGTALGVVLHDLEHAAAVADDVVLLRGGRVEAAGPPGDVLTSTRLTGVYGVPVEVTRDPNDGFLRIEALSAFHRRRVAAHPPTVRTP